MSGIRLEVDAGELADELVPRIVDAVVARLKSWQPLDEIAQGLERVVTVDQLAQHLSISRSAITSRVKAGDLPAPRKIAGTMGWLAAELNAHFKGPSSAPPDRGGPTGARSTARARPAPRRPRSGGRSVS